VVASLVARSCSTLNPVSTGLGDRLWAGIPPWFVIKPTRSTRSCIPLRSLNRVPALIGWGKGGNVTSAGWQVTLCDPIWHVSSRSGAMLVAQTAIRFLTLPYYSAHSSSFWRCCAILLASTECVCVTVTGDDINKSRWRGSLCSSSVKTISL